MPSAFDPVSPGGRSGPRSVDFTSKVGQSNQSQIVGAGKIQVGMSDPSTTIQQSIGNFNAGFIGVGKGLVSVVENLPVVGGIAKPIIGLVGGVADATVGQVVRAAEGVRIGNRNLAQAGVGVLEGIGSVTVKPALDALTYLGIETERAVGRARILSTRNNQKDFIISTFGEAPQAALDAMSSGASLEDAAEQLAASNAGFSQNGAANFLWSIVLDPMNLIAPGVGKAVSTSAQAAKFAAIGADALQTLEKTARVSGNLELAAKYADELSFLNKYDWMGKIYSSTLGKLSLASRRFSSTIAKESALGLFKVVEIKNVNPFLDDLAKVVGREVLNRGLNNYAVTFANAIKAGAIRIRATITRSNGADFADRFIGHAIEGVASNKTKEEILSQAAGNSTIGQLLREYGLVDDDLNKLFQALDAKKGVRSDELRRVKEVSEVRDVIEKLAANARVRKEKDLIRQSAMFRQDLDSRIASEEAIRVLRQDKDNRIPAASRREQGIEELTQDIVAGFGAKPELARQIAIAQFDRLGDNVQALADVLTVARGAANGQAMRKLAVLRRSVAGITITIKTKKGERVVDLGRITMTSSRSITQSQTEEAIQRFNVLEETLTKAIANKDEALIAVTKKQLRDEADRLVSQFDDFGKRFAPGRYTYSEVRAYLDKSVNLTVQEVGPLERAQILAAAAKNPALRQILEVEKELEKLGYRLGIAPEDDLSRVQTVVTDHYGRETVDEILMPFSDTIDHIAIDGLDNALVAEKLRPTKLGQIWEKFSRPYGPEITKSNIAERFVTSMVQKTGISVNKARQIFVETNNIAAKRGAERELGGGKLQGLYVVKSEVEQVFRRVMQDDYGRLKDAGTEPIKEIFSAAAGDWSVAGLTSGFTGRVKAIAPEITVLTDILYPELRFGRLNPYFNLLLERTETEIQKIVHRIKTERADDFLGELRSSAMRRAHLDPNNVNREINDAVMKMSERATRSMSATAIQSVSLRSRVSSRMRQWFSIQGVKDTKEFARDMTGDQFANREFFEILEGNRPGALRIVAQHFGATNADEVLELVFNEYLIHSDPILFARHVEKTGKVARRLSVDELVAGGMKKADAESIVASVIGAYEIALLKGSRAADKAQYFSNHRTWFERSVNHPMLAFYPYSYMVQKAIPSLLKIMFLTPSPIPGLRGEIYFGGGYIAYEKVAEWMENSMNSDQDVVAQLVKDDALLYLITTLLPVTPDSMGFSLPAWARRGLIQPGLRGTELTPGEVAPTLSEVVSQVGRGTAFGQVRTTLEALQGIEDATQSNEIISEFIQSSSKVLQEKALELRNP